MKYQWNTGRMYAKDGQLIVAQVVPDQTRATGGHILFSDLSRHINGVIPLGQYAVAQISDKYALEKVVMCNYDHGNWSGSQVTLAWESPTGVKENLNGVCSSHSQPSLSDTGVQVDGEAK